MFLSGNDVLKGSNGYYRGVTTRVEIKEEKGSEEGGGGGRKQKEKSRLIPSYVNTVPH